MQLHETETCTLDGTSAHVSNRLLSIAASQRISLQSRNLIGIMNQNGYIILGVSWFENITSRGVQNDYMEGWTGEANSRREDGQKVEPMWETECVAFDTRLQMR